MKNIQTGAIQRERRKMKPTIVIKMSIGITNTANKKATPARPSENCLRKCMVLIGGIFEGGDGYLSSNSKLTPRQETLGFAQASVKSALQLWSNIK